MYASVYMYFLVCRYCLIVRPLFLVLRIYSRFLILAFNIDYTRSCFWSQGCLLLVLVWRIRTVACKLILAAAV